MISGAVTFLCCVNKFCDTWSLPAPHTHGLWPLCVLERQFWVGSLCASAPHRSKVPCKLCALAGTCWVQRGKVAPGFCHLTASFQWSRDFPGTSQKQVQRAPSQAPALGGHSQASDSEWAGPSGDPQPDPRGSLPHGTWGHKQGAMWGESVGATGTRL